MHSIKCPYCISEIDGQSLVCKVCHRDLYLLKPLLEKIADLEVKAARVPQMEAEIENLRSQLAEPITPLVETSRSFGIRLGLGGLATCTLLSLLLLAHWLIIILYDLSPVYLRVVSLLLPLPLGFMFASRWRFGWIPVVGMSALLSAATVVGMSWLTSLVDHTPVLPQSALEWREFVEYAISVMFSVVTGFLLCRAKRRTQTSSIQSVQLGTGAILRVAKWVDVGGSAASLQARVEHLQSLWRTLTMAGASLLSIYTGLKGVIG